MHHGSSVAWQRRDLRGECYEGTEQAQQEHLEVPRGATGEWRRVLFDMHDG